VFCVKCGKQYAPDHTFCNHCGQLLPAVVAAEAEIVPAQSTATAMVKEEVEEPPAPITPEPEVTIQEPPQSPQASPPVPAAPQQPPYAQFVVFFLGATLVVSVLAFDVGQALTRRTWESIAIDLVAMIGTAILVSKTRNTWRDIISIEPETEKRHRRTLRNGTIIALLFFTAAALIGAGIGKNRDEAIQLSTDLEQMKTIGSRISKARNLVEASIPSYTRMYKSIGEDVDDLEATFESLKTELAIYDTKFPAQHQTTTDSIASVEQGLKRMALVKKQIALMKTIETLSSDDQITTWRTSMMPLLEQEDALNGK